MATTGLIAYSLSVIAACLSLLFGVLASISANWAYVTDALAMKQRFSLGLLRYCNSDSSFITVFSSKCHNYDDTQFYGDFPAHRHAAFAFVIVFFVKLFLGLIFAYLAWVRPRGRRVCLARYLSFTSAAAGLVTLILWAVMVQSDLTDLVGRLGAVKFDRSFVLMCLATGAELLSFVFVVFTKPRDHAIMYQRIAVATDVHVQHQPHYGTARPAAPQPRTLDPYSTASYQQPAAPRGAASAPEAPPSYEEAKRTMSAAFCPRCGAGAVPNARFCALCGNPL